MRAEELPHRRSTEYLFNEAVRSLIAAGKTRCDGLQGKDVIGVYVACAVALARKNLPDLDMAHLLRAAADVLDEKETMHDQAIN